MEGKSVAEPAARAKEFLKVAQAVDDGVDHAFDGDVAQALERGQQGSLPTR
jgi:hypothetical protein